MNKYYKFENAKIRKKNDTHVTFFLFFFFVTFLLVIEKKIVSLQFDYN
jgi:hypothetical protein